ncbi:hypothetical protein AYL99_03499 [Fonsecaea erecta]|uniref:Uncharacterized protein n=1 Tax=Fonsecaea erecta TaxID=1367422 RepID=A0A178ZNA3_9EURO|nr:hypothetical protein AYL99_03499 [Fonsecaea erecta]OAP61298.1 hypothetical protein AYL99_03499 [Fonsecaea erecta]
MGKTVALGLKILIDKVHEGTLPASRFATDPKDFLTGPKPFNEHIGFGTPMTSSALACRIEYPALGLAEVDDTPLNHVASFFHLRKGQSVKQTASGRILSLILQILCLHMLLLSRFLEYGILAVEAVTVWSELR